MPIVFDYAFAEPALNVDLLAVVGRVTNLACHLGITACSRHIAVGRADVLDSWSLYIAVLSIIRLHHGYMRHRGCYTWRQRRRLEVDEVGVVGVDNVAVHLQLAISKCFSSSSFSCSRRAGSFLSCCVFFRKALLPSFCFPIVISNASTVFYDSAAELSEHRPRGNESYLS